MHWCKKLRKKETKKIVKWQQFFYPAKFEVSLVYKSNVIFCQRQSEQGLLSLVVLDLSNSLNLRKILDNQGSTFWLASTVSKLSHTYVLLLDFTNHYLPEFEDKMDLVRNFNCFLKLRKKIRRSVFRFHFVEMQF